MGYSLSASDDHCYPGTTVLVNRLGLKSQEALNRAEMMAVSLHAIDIEEEMPQERFTFSFYCRLHARLFGDLYDWAGKLRSVNLTKKGTSFYRADQLERLGSAKFQYLQEMHEFRDLPRAMFVTQVSEFYHDLNMLHPFREGNGRTQRLFFTLLIRRAGYNIDFSCCDMDELMIATIFAAQGVMDYLIDFFDRTIED